MKRIGLIALALFSPVYAFGQSNPDESVIVEAPRLPYSPFGPIAWSPGGTLEPPHGCAEPRCGELPPDPTGGSALTQAQKTANNKQAKQKAKAQQAKIGPTMKSDLDLWKLLFGWMDGASVDASANVHFKFTTKGGASGEGGGCVQYHAKLNPKDPAANDYCTEREVNTETVKRVDGTYATQLRLTYAVYDSCYWEGTCGVDIIRFAAGSKDELRGFINETLGEQFL